MGTSEIIRRAMGEDITRYMQMQQLTTQTAATTAEARRMAEAMKTQAEQFQAREQRAESTALMQGLLSMFGMQTQLKIAGMKQKTTGMTPDKLLAFMGYQSGRRDEMESRRTEALKVMPQDLDPTIEKDLAIFNDNLHIGTDESLAANNDMVNKWNNLPREDATDGKRANQNIWTSRQALKRTGLPRRALGYASLALRYLWPAFTSYRDRVSKYLDIEMSPEAQERISSFTSTSGEYENLYIDNSAILDLSTPNAKLGSQDLLGHLTEGFLQSMLDEIIKTPSEQRTGLQLVTLQLLASMGDLNKAAMSFARAKTHPTASEMGELPSTVSSILAANGWTMTVTPVVNPQASQFLESYSRQMTPAREAYTVARNFTQMYAPEGAQEQIMRQLTGHLTSDIGRTGRTSLSNILQRMDARATAEQDALMNFYERSAQIMLDMMSDRGIPNVLQKSIYSGYKDPLYQQEMSYIKGTLSDIAVSTVAGGDAGIKVARELGDDLQKHIQNIDVGSSSQEDIRDFITREMFKILQGFGVYSFEEKPIIGWATITTEGE